MSPHTQGMTFSLADAGRLVGITPDKIRRLQQDGFLTLPDYVTAHGSGKSTRYYIPATKITEMGRLVKTAELAWSTESTTRRQAQAAAMRAAKAAKTTTAAPPSDARVLQALREQHQALQELSRELRTLSALLRALGLQVPPHDEAPTR